MDLCVHPASGARTSKCARAGEKLPPERIEPILQRVKRRWSEVGYEGDHRAWIETKRSA